MIGSRLLTIYIPLKTAGRVHFLLPSRGKYAETGLKRVCAGVFGFQGFIRRGEGGGFWEFLRIFPKSCVPICAFSSGEERKTHGFWQTGTAGLQRNVGKVIPCLRQRLARSNRVKAREQEQLSGTFQNKTVWDVSTRKYRADKQAGQRDTAQVDENATQTGQSLLNGVVRRFSFLAKTFIFSQEPARRVFGSVL
jgi:hypothetical protein